MLCVYLNQIPSLPLCDANGLQVNAILHPGWFSGQVRCPPQAVGNTALNKQKG